MSDVPDPGDLLLGAIALWFVIEGLLPFFSPTLWRRAFERALKMTDAQIRYFGLGSMLIGLALLAIFWN